MDGICFKKSRWFPLQPGSGDRVCSDHFVSRKKSDLPSSPDFVPSVRSVESDLPGCSILNEDSYCHFERARNRARLQEQHSKAVEKNRQEVELEQAWQKGIQRAITHDHTYANNGGELVSLEEPLGEGSVVHEEHSDLSDERLNEDEELNRELLSKRYDTGVPVKVGKAQFGEEIHVYFYLFSTTECQTEMNWLAVETKISMLEKRLKDRPEISVETVLMGNDKITRFYTGMPTYDTFLSLVEYLEPRPCN